MKKNKNFSDCTQQPGENSANGSSQESANATQARKERNQNKNFSAVTDCTKQQGRKPSIEAKAKSQASPATYAQVLKGGAKQGQLSQIFVDTIQVAKNHRINLKSDIPNKAAGNCLFESVVYNVNHRPESFPNKLDEDVDNNRFLWVTELEEQYKETPHYPGFVSRPTTEPERSLWDAQISLWDAAWNQQKNTFEYNVDAFSVSDLTPAGLGHCINKNILVFSNDPNDPIKVFSANRFEKNGQIETEDPVILAHDSAGHYESLLPKGKTDVPKCIELVKAIQSNSYEKMNPMDYWNKAQKAKKREAERQRTANKSDNAKRARKEQNTANVADARSKESAEATKARKEQNTANMADARSKESAEAAKARKAENRERAKNHDGNFEGHKAKQNSARYGQVPGHVEPVNLGDMTAQCYECGAFMFPWESHKKTKDGLLTFSLCCSHGKIKIPDEPNFPSTLQELLTERNAQSNEF